MLIIVIKNPILFTIVRADPTYSWGAEVATKAENCGESPATTIPQKIKNPRYISNGREKIRGERTQHIPDASN